MCKTYLSYMDQRTSSSSPSTGSREQRRLLRRIFKVPSTQDLSKRCALPTPGLDILGFQKFTELPGLLGEQFFQALDSDGDDCLSLEDFVAGFLALYQGSYEEVAGLLFRVMDFGQKGYLTAEDMRALLLYLPTVCGKCGKRVVQHWHVADKIKACFQGNEILKEEDFMVVLSSHNEVFSHVLQSLLNSMPTAFDAAFDAPLPVCEETYNSKTSDDFGFQPLRYKLRRYYCEVKHQTLYYYTSVTSVIPKGVILIKSLFIEPRGDLGFALCDTGIRYDFEADSQRERDIWIRRLQEETHFRSFDDYYERQEVLGAGSFAQVVKAVSRLNGQPAAVKIIRKEPLDVKSEIQLRREIEILRYARHANLVQLYDVFETQEYLYIVTEYVAGGSLFEWLDARKFRITEKVAKGLVADIARGLSFLHENGVVHRDVKLENVLLVQDGDQVTAKLIDYGLSCFLGPGQSSKDPVGTLKYAAPEVIARQQYRHKVDCWGLGVILFILLKGTVPFFGRTDQEVALQVLKKKLLIEGEEWAHVSSRGRQVLSSLLDRNPEKRPELEALLADQWLQ